MCIRDRYKRSRYVGRLFQDPLKGTAPHMTIEENMALAYLRTAKASSAFSTITKKDRDYFAQRLAALGLGLEDRLKQPVGLLSGGQRQALTLLMATLVTPKLLLLDEHTAALDPGTAEKVLELTRKIVSENKITCLMITHNISSALELGNRTIMMLSLIHILMAGCSGAASSSSSSSASSTASSDSTSSDLPEVDFSAGLTADGLLEGVTALDYVTLPEDYDHISLPADVTTATDEDIQASIDSRCV